jgi:hypothetical protein
VVVKTQAGSGFRTCGCENLWDFVSPSVHSSLCGASVQSEELSFEDVPISSKNLCSKGPSIQIPFKFRVFFALSTVMVFSHFSFRSRYIYQWIIYIRLKRNLGRPAKNDCSTEVLLDFCTRMTFLRSVPGLISRVFWKWPRNDGMWHVSQRGNHVVGDTVDCSATWTISKERLICCAVSVVLLYAT